MLTCSLVIRTLNEARYLGSLLDAVAAQDYPRDSVDVIIVDSGSNDATLQIAEQHRCKVLKIRREDFSFGRSLNVGCDAAKGDVLIFISGHCVPVDGKWLSRLVAPFSDSKVAVTYGRQLGGPETKFSEHSLFGKYFPATAENPQAPFFCNNANAAFRRTAWAARRFDETLTGLEDMHLAKQCVEAGFRVAYVPGAAVYHFHHEQWRQVKRRYEREAIALQAIMPEVHVRGGDAVRYFFAGLLGDAARAVREKVLFRHIASIVAFRFCQYYGVWRGNHIHRKLSHRQKERYFYPN